MYGGDHINNPKPDRRVRYTRMVLRESLLSLLTDTPIKRVTVKDICEGADVNRGTFYAHYKDPDDQLTKIEDEFLATIQDAILRRTGNEANTSELLHEIMRCIAENADLCTILLGKNGHADFLERVAGMAREPFLSVWEKHYGENGPVRGEYPCAFIVNGNIGIIARWLQNGMKEPPEYIAAISDRMSYQGLNFYTAGADGEKER